MVDFSSECLLAIDKSLLKNLNTLPENSGLELFLLLADTERRISVSLGCVESVKKKLLIMALPIDLSRIESRNLTIS